MDDSLVIKSLSSLAQPTRLKAFRLLVAHEPKGLSVGALAEALLVPQNTLSTHLSLLAEAGLVSSVRHSRSIIYRASLTGLRAVITFLMKDCCGGRPEICVPLLADLASSDVTQCCAAERPQP